MKKKLFEKIRKELKKAESALVAGHMDPDGDSIGSSLAVAMLLEKLDITTTIYSQDGIPKVYHFLPWTERVQNKLEPSRRFDLAIVLDSSGIDRLGSKINIRDVAKVVINIDHHPDNTQFGDINYVENSSSAAEQVYQLCKYLKIEVDRKMAECLYVAMITDTGNFRYENTSEVTFEIAAELLRYGVETHEITTRIYDTKSIPSIKINALALSQLEFSDDRKLAWCAVSEEMMRKARAKSEDLIGLVDQIRSIEGVEVAILFREEREKIKVNFRSKHRINVSEVAKCFGGGGHIKAAGAIVEGNLEKVKQRVTAETLKYVKASKYLT